MPEFFYQQGNNHLEQLYAWYAMHGRHQLPWRNTADAYHILVSEVMLQQTQVKTVLERYYHPFLKNFPTLHALAETSAQEVLNAWQGLGYYSRAINLHRTAQLAVPRLPEQVEALMRLPGIGKNTAHAVAAFAYHQAVPVMEANVKRVLHRLFAKTSLTEKALWDYATALLDKDNPFDYNQAMMDIGAMVCTARQPQCLLCPLADLCEGKHNPEAYPAKKIKKTVPVRRKTIVVFSHTDDGGNLWRHMEKRETRFLHGLYRFAEYDIAQPVTFDNRRYALEALTLLGEIVQTYSHFRLEATVYLATLEDIEKSQGWRPQAEWETLPVSGAEEKIYKMLGNPK